MSNQKYEFSTSRFYTPGLNYHLVIIIFGLFLFGLGLTACNASASAPEAEPEQVAESRPAYTGKKILWVDSYHKGYEWSDGIESGLRDVLDDSGVEFKVLRMDTKRNTGDEFAQKAADQARTEIDSFEPDVLIASDDNAQKYLIVPHYRDTDLPVVFNGVNWDASIYDYPAQNVTGMVEVELPAQLVGHLKNYVQGDKLGYLTVDSNTERKVAEIYNQRFFDGQMKVYFVKSYDEFKETFIKAQDEVDLLIIGTNAGIDRWDEAEVEAFITENTKIPTGTLYDWLAPYTLITLAKRADEQGEWAAQAALKLLDGASVAEIPVTENKQGELILNLNIAEKLDIVFSPSLLRHAQIYGLEGGGQ